MKSLLAACGCLAIALCLASSAQSTQFKDIQLKFVTTQVPALPDSNFKIRSAATVAASTAQPIDTTAWVPIWSQVQWPTALAAADTITTLFMVTPESIAGAPAAAMDTITVTCQVSADASSPVVATNAGFANPVGLETSSNNSTYFPVPLGRGYAATGTAPTTRQLLPYRFIRFILTSDKVGPFTAIWRIPVPDDPATLHGTN